MDSDLERTVATTDMHARHRLLPLAPASRTQAGPNANAADSQTLMPSTCKTCARRKVKCDKVAPACSSCRKSKIECLYQSPSPRNVAKRKPDDDVLEKLARYELILNQHGLLPAEPRAPSLAAPSPPHEPISLHWNERSASRPGKLLSGPGTSRYVDNNLWHKLGADDIQAVSDEEEAEEYEHVAPVCRGEASSLDPLTMAFAAPNRPKSLGECYPTPEMASALWQTYTERVDSVVKVLHIPSAARMVEMASERRSATSKVDQCLLFAIYHFATFSMTESECYERLGCLRATLLSRYHLATRQALVNASFLKSTDLSILQALVLFLAAGRTSYDSQTYWVLVGVAVRIAQRMGLHRDGEALGLPPFEVEMRRRLFYQLIPLEGNACQMVGAGPSISPDAWDTKPPLNINDAQIWPGMDEVPQEPQGATEMIFFLSRLCIGKTFAKAGQAGRPVSGAVSSHHFRDYREAEHAISAAEREVEEKYIRYCDVVNPLHFLAAGLARSGVSAMRLRIRLPKVRAGTATDAERKDMFRLAQKILDTDAAAYTHPGLRKYEWYTRSFFIWGMWDSLIFVLKSLWEGANVLSPMDAAAAWAKIEEVYDNHRGFLTSKRALHVAFRHLTLTAWDACRASDAKMVPAFITALQSSCKKRYREGCQNPDDSRVVILPRTDSSPSRRGDSSPAVFPGNESLTGIDDWNLDVGDWVFWDKLTQDHGQTGFGNLGDDF